MVVHAQVLSLCRMPSRRLVSKSLSCPKGRQCYSLWTDWTKSHNSGWMQNLRNCLLESKIKLICWNSFIHSLKTKSRFIRIRIIFQQIGISKTNIFGYAMDRCWTKGKHWLPFGQLYPHVGVWMGPSEQNTNDRLACHILSRWVS